jgi:hypothetical protein
MSETQDNMSQSPASPLLYEDKERISPHESLAIGLEYADTLSLSPVHGAYHRCSLRSLASGGHGEGAALKHQSPDRAATP